MDRQNENVGKIFELQERKENPEVMLGAEKWENPERVEEGKEGEGVWKWEGRRESGLRRKGVTVA